MLSEGIFYNDCHCALCQVRKQHQNVKPLARAVAGKVFWSVVCQLLLGCVFTISIFHFTGKVSVTIITETLR